MGERYLGGAPGRLFPATEPTSGGEGGVEVRLTRSDISVMADCSSSETRLVKASRDSGSLASQNQLARFLLPFVVVCPIADRLAHASLRLFPRGAGLCAGFKA